MRSKFGKWLIELGYRLLLPNERAHWDAICMLGSKALEVLQRQQTKSCGVRVPTVETEQPPRPTLH